MRGFSVAVVIVACAVSMQAADKSKASKPVPESSLTEGPEGRPLAKGKVNLLGQAKDWKQFLSACKKRDGRALKTGAFDGKPTKIIGQIANIGSDSWTIYTREGKNGWEDPVTVSLEEIGGNEGAEQSGYKVGNLIAVCGIASEGASLRAWAAELLPPGVAWVAKLRDPGAVIGGEEQTFHVDCVVKNTGRQPLVNVVMAVRLAQVESPNDEFETYTIESLAPGQSVSFSVPFDFYNFQYIGKTSLPVGAAKVIGYEL